jgi:hypothetical protein
VFAGVESKAEWWGMRLGWLGVNRVAPLTIQSEIKRVISS